MRKVYFTAFFALYSCLVIAAPDDYYIEAFGKIGNELKMALHTIIDNHTVLEYTNRNNDNWIDGENLDVWEALVYTDSGCDELAPDCGMIVMLCIQMIFVIFRKLTEVPEVTICGIGNMFGQNLVAFQINLKMGILIYIIYVQPIETSMEYIVTTGMMKEEKLYMISYQMILKFQLLQE